MDLIIKDIPAFQFLGARLSLTLADIAVKIEPLANSLHAMADEKGIAIVAPVVHIFSGIDGNPATLFELQIAAPVATSAHAIDLPAPFYIAEAPAVKVVAAVYNGSMMGLENAWSTFGEAASAAGHPFTGNLREVYTRWVECMSPENITELQMVIG